ncbi:MobF family relaxase [Streptomyces turgidiscabies]|uniref:MobF family relaxase n=2 Tax=Streptomyces turgidiscabies TaxID=85558 RepID=UPI00076E536B|nr:MobF family relaxase [Streptomyces turgidiscabies]MDX3500111.1 MobF family relaxase [Streptomyces turgidiscabies]GAQ77193.1 ATP-dependent RecD-like DNA helicase [Streptomyces turgidiscabies]
MLRITAISGGEAGLNYLLSGSGCAGEHQADAEVTLDGPEGYFAKGTEHGTPLAVWIGEGVAEWGVEAGVNATERDIRAIFGRHAHPEEYRAAVSAAKSYIDENGITGTAAEKVMADAEASARRGRKPYEFRTVEQRIDARLEAEPHADPERIAEIRREERDKGQRSPAMYFDHTYSAQKSVSTYLTALEAAGRHEDAAKVRGAMNEGIAAAMKVFEEEAGFGRIGYHGTAKNGRPSTGRYVDSEGFTAAIFTHEVSRAGDPQLHAHVAVLNKIKVHEADGNEHFVTLDSRAVSKAREAAAAVFERTMEQAIERDLPVVFELRPDGLAREIKGFEPELLDALSERTYEIDARYEELREQYVQDHGREPSPYTRARLREMATLDTRDPKRNEHQSAEARVERATRLAEEKVEGGLLGALEKAEQVGIETRLAEVDVPEFDREQVIMEALEALQTKRSTWDRSELIQQLNTTLGDDLPRDVPLAPLANDLANEALKSGRYGVVQTAGLKIIEDAPSRIRQSDGRSVFSPSALASEKFALEEHLDDEGRVASRAHQTGAPCLSQPTIEHVVKASGVTADQADVVRGVLGDSRKVSVIEGPAGAGKSYTTGVIAKAWEEHTGGRVIGLGPSAVAAEVLGEEGIEIRTNTTRFLDYYSQGLGRREDVETFRLRAGDLVVLDEAGMASTDHITRISDMCDAVGAKLVPIGDQQQLQSPEAGGLLRTMVEEGPHYSLSNVRRFKEPDGTVREWEAKASLALRRGEVRALDEYELQGRIQGGTLEQMKADVVQAFVADTLAQRESVVMTATNTRATELSREIRAQLVRYGHVEENGLPLVDDNRAGVGDLIQTRENDAKLKDSEGRMVLNRRVYRVTGVGEDGQLVARRVAGRDTDGTERLAGTITLPGDYVRENVALAYAGTVHAVQGRTVGYGGYLLVEEGMNRQQVYPGLTRAQRYNRAFAACQVPADEHRLQSLDQDAMSMLQAAIERDGGELSALQELRESQDWAESIPALEPEWRDYVTEHTRNQYEPMLRQLLSEDHYKKLRQGDPSTVYRKLREAELAGHDGKRVLASAIAMRPMSYPVPDNVPSLVNWRIDTILDDRTPENEPAGHSWCDRTPEIPGIEGEVARKLAEAMDARRDVLGERLAEEPPEWAIRHLGPVPEDVLDRAEWERNAGTVEGYRELYNIDAPNTAIGRLPAKGAVEQRAAWEAAHSALGRTEEQETLARTSDAALREMVNRYQRETSWAPAHMGAELSEARQMVLRYEEKAILAQADADQCEDAAERAELEAQARGYEDLVGSMSARVEVMEQIDEARSAWYEETAPAREAAEAARDELDRRGHDDQAQQDADEAEQQRGQELDEELVAEPEYDLDQAPEMDWEVEGETLDQVPDVRDEAELAPELTYQEQEELDQALAAYEERYRAAAEVEDLDVDQAPAVDWGDVPGFDESAPELDDVAQQLAEEDEQQRVQDELAAEAAAYHEARQVEESVDAPEADVPQAEESAQVTAEADPYVYEPNPEVDAAIAAFEQRLREQAEAAREAEPEYNLDQVPEIDWEIEGETYAERPEQVAEAGLQPEAPEQDLVAVVSVPSAEEELLRAHYEQQYIDENARIDQERAQRDQLAPAQSSAQELPAQLADLQEDLDRAQGALAEIVARQAERDRADESLQAEQAEQAEAARRQGAEVEVTPQIEQDQGPTISYGPQ